MSRGVIKTPHGKPRQRKHDPELTYLTVISLAWPSFNYQPGKLLCAVLICVEVWPMKVRGLLVSALFLVLGSGAARAELIIDDFTAYNVGSLIGQSRGAWFHRSLVR